MMRKRCVLTWSTVGLLAPAGLAVAQSIPRAIYSEIAASPTSSVPGVPGVIFESFDRPYVSPNGNFWILGAETNGATTEDRLIIVGSGLTGNTVVREGINIPGFSEAPGFIDQKLSINDSGDYVFVTNTNLATTTNDEVVVKYTAATNTFSIEAREGDPAPFAPGETHATDMHSPNITNAGVVAYVDNATVGALPIETDEFFVLGNSILAQEGVTTPNNQNPVQGAWDTFLAGDNWVDKTGNNYLARGDLLGATTTDAVVVVNNNVVIQEGAIIPGSGFAAPVVAGAADEAFMYSNGDWLARGNNTDGHDWVLRNGAVVAQKGDAVPGGLAGETFDDTTFADLFFSITANDNGDYVYGGVTSNAATANAVLVFNDSFVFLREGDAIDIDGNGIADDNAFISVFNNDDAILTNDLRYFLTADAVDGNGTALGQVFMVVQVPEPGALSLLSLAAVGLLRRRRIA
jgi:hypothetical protein